MELRSKRILRYSLVKFSKTNETKYYYISTEEKKDKILCYKEISKRNGI